MKTSTKIRIGIPTGANVDDVSSVILDSGDVQAFSDPVDLFDDTFDKVATFEPDYWLLDGSYKFPNEATKVGIMAEDIYETNNNSAPEIVFTIALSTEQKFTGLIFRFSDGLPYSVGLGYQTDGESTITTESFSRADIVNGEYRTETIVDGVGFIVVTMTGSQAGRYTRLLGLEFDTQDVLTFEGQQVKSATLVEEIDLISTTLPANSLEFEIISNDARLDITDPNSALLQLEEETPVDAWEIIAGNQVYLGRFYLDEWRRTRTGVVFDAYNLIGLIDRYEVEYIPATINYEIEDTADLFLDPFGIAATYTDISEEKTLKQVKTKNVRESLQRCVFGIGYIINARSNQLDFYKFIPIVENTTFTDIGRDEISLEENLSMLPKISHILWQDYFGTFGPTENVVNGSLPLGTNILEFDNPTFSVTLVSGGANLNQPDDFYVDIGLYYIILDVTGSGTIVIDRDIAVYTYIPITADNPLGTTGGVTVDVQELRVTIDNPNVVDVLFEYYNMRYILTSKVYAKNLSIGETIKYELNNGKFFYGYVTKLISDLTGGFTQKMTALGIVSEEIDFEETFFNGKYDTTDARIAYTGSWSTASAAEAYGGSVRFVSTGQSGYAEFQFYGRQFIFVYSRLTDRGTADVTIDGVVVATVNQNGSTQWQTEWESPVLSRGLHTVRITKNTGNVIDFDALEIIY